MFSVGVFAFVWFVFRAFMPAKNGARVQDSEFAAKRSHADEEKPSDK